MDPAQIRIIWKAFIKKKGAEFYFRKIRPSPILWELFKYKSDSLF